MLRLNPKQSSKNFLKTKVLVIYCPKRFVTETQSLVRALEESFSPLLVLFFKLPLAQNLSDSKLISEEKKIEIEKAWKLDKWTNCFKVHSDRALSDFKDGTTSIFVM